MISSKIPLEPGDFVLLREYIQKEFGIVIGDEKATFIEGYLSNLVIECGCKTFREFYHKAKMDTTGNLRNKIIDAITIFETSWFRDNKPWGIVDELIVPRFISDIRSGRKSQIQVWSAGVSTGEEIYSFAMILLEALTRYPMINPSTFSILATDISPSALYRAISGRYSVQAMRKGMIPHFRERYFTEEDGISEISKDVRDMVTFSPFNLQLDFINIPSCDLIFLRNVAVYFPFESKKKLFDKMFHNLNDDGYLLIGESESLDGISTKFRKHEYKKSAYYVAKR